MSDKQLDKLLDRIAKLEADVEQLKSSGQCSGGLLSLFGIMNDNPLFPEVAAQMAAERQAERDVASKRVVKPNPSLKRTTRRAVAPKR